MSLVQMKRKKSRFAIQTRCDVSWTDQIHTIPRKGRVTPASDDMFIGQHDAREKRQESTRSKKRETSSID